jgi:hypothetical protein
MKMNLNIAIIKNICYIHKYQKVGVKIKASSAEVAVIYIFLAKIFSHENLKIKV